MSKGVARLGDTTSGTCYHPSHLVPISVSGTITSASSTYIVNGRGAARLDDQVTTSCGHTDYINSASGTCIADPKPVARLGDTVGKNGIYIATITSASGDVIADD